MTSKATKSIFFSPLTYFKAVPQGLANLPEYFHTTFASLAKSKPRIRHHPVLLCPETATRFLRWIPPQDFQGRMMVENNAGLGLLSYAASQLVRQGHDERAKALASIRNWRLIDNYTFLKDHLERHAQELESLWPTQVSNADHMDPNFYSNECHESEVAWNQPTPPPITFFCTYSYKYGNMALLHDFKLMGSKAGIFKFGEFPIYATLPRRYTETMSASPGDVDRSRLSALCQVVCRFDILDSAEPLAYAPFKSEMDFVRITPYPQPMYKGNFEEFDKIIMKLFLRPKRELQEALGLLDPTGKLSKMVPPQMLYTSVHALTNRELCTIANLIRDWPSKHHFLLLD